MGKTREKMSSGIKFQTLLLLSLSVMVTGLIQFPVTQEPTAFSEILIHQNGPLSAVTEIQQEALQEIYGELFEKTECEEKLSASDCRTVWLRSSISATSYNIVEITTNLCSLFDRKTGML